MPETDVPLENEPTVLFSHLLPQASSDVFYFFCTATSKSSSQLVVTRIRNLDTSILSRILLIVPRS